MKMQLRFARHTDRLMEVVGLYRDGLGLPEIGRFANHDGRINTVDLKAYGVASNIAVVPFEIHD